MEALTDQEWLDVTMCDDEQFRKDECKRIFSEGVDYYDGEMMRRSDEHFGDLIDCLAFAKRYRIVVVIYNCGINVEECNTHVFDGSPVTPIYHYHPGIRNNIVLVSSEVLELVRYKTDLIEMEVKKKTPFKGVAQGPGHFVFVRRSPEAPVNEVTHQKVSLSKIGFHRSNFLPNYVGISYLIIQRTR